MAAFVAKILGGDALTGVSKVIDSIRGKSPEDAAKLEQLKMQYASAFQLAELETKKDALQSYDAEVQAAGGIISTEAKSQSWLPRNVRPLCLLIWGCIISFAVIFNAYEMHVNPKFVALVIDPWVYKLTAIGFTGYVTARTWEKVSDKDN